MVKDYKGTPVYFKQFKGKLVTFIKLPDGRSDGFLDFYNIVVKDLSPKIFYYSDGTS